MSITVEGGHIDWEERCLAALHERPFKFVASDGGSGEGREFLASCAPFLGPVRVVHVGVVPNGADSTRLHLSAAVQADNLLRKLLRPGARVLMNRLRRALDVP